MKDMFKNKQGLTEEEFFREYDANKYKRPSFTVDILIFTVVDEEEKNYRKLPEKSLKILLVKRADHPFIGMWALPGGFVSTEESLDEAASRVLMKETNIDDIYMEQLYTWGDINRDPRTRVVSSSYMALLDSKSLNVKPGSDETDAKWFKIDYRLLQENKKVVNKNQCMDEKIVEIKLWNNSETLSAKIKIKENIDGRISREIIETVGIAFDHGKFIEYAIDRLRNKIEYTSVVFNLMPELFTLTELQMVYEIILGKELLPAAFRRKVANMVIDTNEFAKYSGHRPSKLFRYNLGWKRNV